MNATSAKVAVLIDSENVSTKYAQKIFEKASSYGDVIVRRAYGNQQSCTSWTDALLKHAVEFRVCLRHVAGKGTSDMAMAIDAMDLMHKKIVSEFCLVTSDSDFSGLAMKLREGGMHVYGIGKSAAVASFISSCDEYYKLDDGGQQEGQATIVASAPDQEIREMILAACDYLPGDNDGWINLAVVGGYIKRINPDFVLPKKLSELVKTMDDNFELQVDKRDNTTVYIRKK